MRAETKRYIRRALQPSNLIRVMPAKGVEFYKAIGIRARPKTIKPYAHS